MKNGLEGFDFTGCALPFVKTSWRNREKPFGPAPLAP